MKRSTVALSVLLVCVVVYFLLYAIVLWKNAPHAQELQDEYVRSGKHLYAALTYHDLASGDSTFRYPDSIDDALARYPAASVDSRHGFSLTTVRWRPYEETNTLLLAYSDRLPEAKPPPLWPQMIQVPGWPETNIPARRILVYSDGTISVLAESGFAETLDAQRALAQEFGYNKPRRP